MKVFLDSVGCRLNQSEIEKMAWQFRMAGNEIVDRAAEADLVVINTCTVTSEAAADSRQKARQAARKGAGEIVLTGCWSTLEPEQAKKLTNIRMVVPNDRKDRLVEALIGSPKAGIVPPDQQRQPLPGSHKRTRAFIKVQDGCANHCTFCITTIARGPRRSQSIKEVLDDIQMAVQGGAKEVVLTGVHLGSWGQDFRNENKDLRDLVQTILNNTDVARLRLSSIEPWDLDEKFFELWRDPRLCRHLHLPLQSGSAEVLRRMARKINPVEYAKLLSVARSIIPNVSITTDLIAGFPGETEAEFIETLEFVEKMNFSGGHVFTYSARPGTAAARMEPQVPHPIRKSRNAILRGLLANSSRNYTESFIGVKLPVLWISSDLVEPGSWRLEGLTDNYLTVRSSASEPRWNLIDWVQVDAFLQGGLYGKIVQHPQEKSGY